MRILIALVLTCLLSVAASAQSALHIAVKSLPPAKGAVPVQIKVSGGTPPFKVVVSVAGREVKLTGGQRTFETPVKLRSGDEHTVGVTVEDAAGNMDFSSVQVGDAPSASGPLTVTLLPPPPLVEVGQQFRVNWKAQGGKPPYRHLWQTPYGESPHHVLGVKARQGGAVSIRLRVTDAAGTTVQRSLTIHAVERITSTIAGPRAPVVGRPCVYTAAVVGGTPPYRVVWTDGAHTATGTRATWTFSKPGATRLSIKVYDAGLHKRAPSTSTLEVSAQK